MNEKTAKFWQSDSAASPVERRVVWQGSEGGELGISIAPDWPVPNLTRMSEGMVTTATAHLSDPNQILAPQFIFAMIGKSDAGHSIVKGPGGQEFPIFMAEPSTAVESMNIQDAMNRAKAAMPPAQVAPGDSAVGFLIRTDKSRFYPLVAVTTPEEIESYREGAGTTADLIHSLPFQN
jgi:hypothetical protein